MWWPDQQFWDSFGPNFAANLASDLITLGLAVLAIPWIAGRIRRADARVLARAYESALRSQVKEVIFSILNNGRMPFREGDIFWHIFVEPGPRILLHEGDYEHRGSVLLRGREFTYYHGVLKQAAFPGRVTKILTISVELGDRQTWEMYYFLSTSAGIMPKQVKADKVGGVDTETAAPVDFAVARLDRGAPEWRVE